MPWVRFNANFDWRRSPKVTVVYKAGMVQLVSQACRDAAVAAGKAEDAPRPETALAVTAAPAPAIPPVPAEPPRVRKRKNARK